jgi:hypothetical protein
MTTAIEISIINAYEGSLLSNFTAPEKGLSIPLIVLKRVVFPAPFGPRTT